MYFCSRCDEETPYHHGICADCHEDYNEDASVPYDWGYKPPPAQPSTPGQVWTSEPVSKSDAATSASTTKALSPSSSSPTVHQLALDAFHAAEAKHHEALKEVGEARQALDYADYRLQNATSKSASTTTAKSTSSSPLIAYQLALNGFNAAADRHDNALKEVGEDRRALNDAYDRLAKATASTDLKRRDYVKETLEGMIDWS